MRSILLVCLLVFAIHPDLFGQNLSMIHYGVEDGLPSNQVNEIYKDRNGFLWFATDKGAARYDGLSFKAFTTAEGLPGNDVLSFMEDAYGRLWMALFNGGLCYYKEGRIHSADTDTFLTKNIKTGFIQNFFLQKDSSIIVTFVGSGSFIVFKKEQKRIYTLDSQTVHEVAMISANLFRITDAVLQTVILMDSNGRILSRQRAKVSTVTGAQNEKYLLDDSNIYRSNGSLLFPYRKKGIDQRLIYRVYRNADSMVFIASSDGLYIGSSRRIFAGHAIYSITQDNESNYWITDQNNGVYKIKNWASGAKTYHNMYSGSCAHAFADDSAVYFAIDKRVYRFCNNRTENLLNPQPGKNDRQDYRPLYPQYLLYNNNDYFVFFGARLCLIVNIKNKKRTVHYEQIKKTDQDKAKSIFEHNKAIYLASIRDVQKIDVDGSHRLSWNTILINDSVRRIFTMAGKEGRGLWYATQDGLYEYADGVNIKQEHFGSLSFRWMCFYNQYLLGLTHDDRLVLCNDVYGKTGFDTIQGFVCTKTYQLDSTHLLIATNSLYRLLTLYPPDHIPRYSIQTIEDPFLPLQADFICANKKDCFFLAKGAIHSVPIADLLKKPGPPLLFFTNIRSAAKSISIYFSGDTIIKMSYVASNQIDIGFEAIAPAGAVTYEYSFGTEGTENWLRAETQHVNVSNLGYGSYTVRIRAKTPGSDFCKPITLTFQIDKPFWASWWCITGSILLLVLLVVSIMVKRTRYLLKKRAQRHENELRFLRSEYKALNALMNPHFIFNTLSSFKVLIKNNEPHVANEYLRIFSNLIRQNMHNLSEELISFQREMDLVENYVKLEKLRFKEWLNYTIDIDDEIDTEAMMIPPLIIQPFVENAIKHGLMPLQSENNLLTIKVYEDQGGVQVEITDNGVGIGQGDSSSDKDHQSFGIRNIRQRIDQLALLHGIVIQVAVHAVMNDSGRGKGTRVAITIKFKEIP